MTGDLTPQGSGLSQASLIASRSATETVTRYAQASVTLIPALENMPPWYAPIQQGVTAAQDRSKTWLGNICPAVSSGVPKAIIAFGKTFDTESASILATLHDIGAGKPTASQKASIATSLSKLQQASTTQSLAAAAVIHELQDYNTGLVADVGALGDAIGTLESHLADGNQYVQKLKDAIGENFLDVDSTMTPCDVIVTLNINVQVKVTTVGAPQQAIAIVMAQALVGALDTSVKTTMRPVQDVLDSWGTVHTKIAAVRADLASAGDDYSSVLKGFDMEAAQAQWTQLVEFAQTLLPGGQG